MYIILRPKALENVICFAYDGDSNLVRANPCLSLKLPQQTSLIHPFELSILFTFANST